MRLAAGFLIGLSTNTAKAYRQGLGAWAAWCASLGTHPLAAERHYVDLWVHDLSTRARPRTGRPATPATIARHLAALSRFYDYGIHEVEVLTYSPSARFAALGSATSLGPWV